MLQEDSGCLRLEEASPNLVYLKTIQSVTDSRSISIRNQLGTFTDSVPYTGTELTSTAKEIIILKKPDLSHLQ